MQNRSAEEIEALLEKTVAQMIANQNQGFYKEAEACRAAVAKIKYDLEGQRSYQMEKKQQKERNQVDISQEKEYNDFKEHWENKINDFAVLGDKREQELRAKHETEAQILSEDLEKQLPIKSKESSDLLNLKKMEEHMAKQKNYVEAHKVQQRVKQIEKAENEQWVIVRRLKIETALNTLRAKQQNELMAWKKKVQSGLNEYQKQKGKQEQCLLLKYSNLTKELKSKHDKEVLAHKGQFKSKGSMNMTSPLKRSSVLK